MNLRRFALLPVVLTLSLLSLTACSGAADTAETSPTPSVPASSSAEPVVVEPVSVEEPPAVFDGACENVVTNEQVSNLLQLSVTETSKSGETPPFGGDDMAIRGAGGIYCNWEHESDTSKSLFFTVLSTAVTEGTPGQDVVDYTLASPSDCSSIFEGWCDFSFVENGYWFHGSLTLGSPTADEVVIANSAAEAIAIIDSLRGYAAEAAVRASDASTFTANLDVPGAWAATTDCVALAQTVDVPAMMAAPALALVDSYTGPVEQFPGWNGARSAAGQSSCMWSGESADPSSFLTLYVDFAPGGAWVEDEIAALPGAQKISGEGVDRAYLVAASGSPADQGTTSEAPSIHAFDGVNWVKISSSYVPIDSTHLPLVTSILAAKNQLG